MQSKKSIRERISSHKPLLESDEVFRKLLKSFGINVPEIPEDSKSVTIIKLSEEEPEESDLLDVAPIPKSLKDLIKRKTK